MINSLLYLKDNMLKKRSCMDHQIFFFPAKHPKVTMQLCVPKPATSQHSTTPFTWLKSTHPTAKGSSSAVPYRKRLGAAGCYRYLPGQQPAFFLLQRGLVPQMKGNSTFCADALNPSVRLCMLANSGLIE